MLTYGVAQEVAEVAMAVELGAMDQAAAIHWYRSISHQATCLILQLVVEVAEALEIAAVPLAVLLVQHTQDTVAVQEETQVQAAVQVVAAVAAEPQC